MLHTLPQPHKSYTTLDNIFLKQLFRFMFTIQAISCNIFIFINLRCTGAREIYDIVVKGKIFQ